MTNRNVAYAGILALVMLAPGLAMATATTGAEFQTLYTWILGITSGYLGKTIAISAFLLGLGMGVAKSSPVPALVGIVFAILIAYVPTVMSSVIGALV